MSKRLSLANLLSHLPTTYLHTYLVMSPTDIAVYKITVCSKGTLPIILTKCYSLAIPMINKQKHIPSPWMPSTTTLDQRPISRKRLDCHHEELRLITSISFNCRPPTPCPRATAQPSFTSRPLRKPQPLTLPTPPLLLRSIRKRPRAIQRHMIPSRIPKRSVPRAKRRQRAHCGIAWGSQQN